MWNFCRSTMVSEMFLFKTCCKVMKKNTYVWSSERSNLTGKDCKSPPPVFAETPGHQEYDNLTTKLGRKQLEEAFAQPRCVFEGFHIEVILKTVINQGSHDCFFLCIPRSSRQDIYAMLDLDMPLSEAALRTEGRDHCINQIWPCQVQRGSFWAWEIPNVFSAAKISRLIIFGPIRSPVDSEIKRSASSDTSLSMQQNVSTNPWDIFKSQCTAFLQEQATLLKFYQIPPTIFGSFEGFGKPCYFHVWILHVLNMHNLH